MHILLKSGKITRAIAIMLIMVTGFVSTSVNIVTRSDAATSKVRYIGDAKLFIKKDATHEDAVNWCDSQPENQDSDDSNDWFAVDGDLNGGASAMLKDNMGVFLCCQTTTDRADAITDMAVMNEAGNYSSDEYEILLEQQREVYRDLVSDMKKMIDEYKTNYKTGKTTAIQAHDLLNGFREDDSGKLLGDLLIDINDEELAEVFLKANGQVVLMVQEQLTYAGDSKKTTWLDRMEQLGSYEKLHDKFVKAYKNNKKNAEDALDNSYHEKALLLLESWNDIYQHLESCERFAKDHGLSGMSNEELENWYKEQSNASDKDELSVDAQTYISENELISALGAYKYGESSLLSYFAQKKSLMQKDLHELYPLAASLTDGQIAALNQNVSLFTILMNGLASTGLNDTGAGKSELIKKGAKDSELCDMSDDKKEVSEGIDQIKKTEPISVYEGVDRGLFEGGVAVTSLAKTYQNGYNQTWADALVNSGQLLKLNIYADAGIFMLSAGAVASAMALKSVSGKLLESSFNYFHNLNLGFNAYTDKLWIAGNMKMNQSLMIQKLTWKRFKNRVTSINNNYDLNAAEKAKEIALYNDTRQKLMDAGLKEHVEWSFSYKLLRGLKIGMAVFAVLLAAADIAMNVVTLYKYYNREHLPIPHYMVDLSYDEESETSYINYKNVTDQNGNEGDLNGGGGKQWLALYQTKDKDAGEPILASYGKNSGLNVVLRSSTAPNGYSPLHKFGEPNVAQNLTYSDGENGYSYNDKNGGTYLFFMRAGSSAPDIDDGEESDGSEPSTATTEEAASGESVSDNGVGTVTAGGGIFVAGAAGLVIGIVIGFAGVYVRRRR